jgi:hypothetical protein
MRRYAQDAGPGSGAWLMPFYYTPNGYGKFSAHFSVLKISNDQGKSWKDHKMTAAVGRCRLSL